jgi:O-methyltransferase
MGLLWKAKRWLNTELQRRHYLLMKYGDATRPAILDRARQIAAEVDFLLDPTESCQIVNALQQTTKVSGDVAEVGVYQGGSAKLIAEFKGNRPLHLFDTFAGLPAAQPGDAKRFATGMYAADLKAVQRYLNGYPGIFFYPGLFPDTGEPVRHKRFSFVHLDVDLYDSTLACLNFFYPRLQPGGILISHDYSNAEGVRRAFAEFFANRRDPVLEVALSQALVVKVDVEPGS